MSDVRQKRESKYNDEATQADAGISFLLDFVLQVP